MSPQAAQQGINFQDKSEELNPSEGLDLMIETEKSSAVSNPGHQEMMPPLNPSRHQKNQTYFFKLSIPSASPLP